MNKSSARRVLFRIASCPYCQRAEQALDASGLEYEKIDIDPADRSLVQLLSGQPTVPILVEVHGCQAQDDDIIAYLEEKGL